DESDSALPAAPSADGVPYAPRQVQAGISQAVDAIVCRCLGIGGEPLTSPAELAKALRGVPRTPLPLFAGLGHAPPAPRPTAQRRPAAPPAAPSTQAATQPHQPPGHDRHQASSHVPPPRARPPPPARRPRTSAARTAAVPGRSATAPSSPSPRRPSPSSSG